MCIEFKRLEVESVERLREESVLERFRAAVGSMREDVEVGKEVVRSIVLTTSQHRGRLSLRMLHQDCNIYCGAILCERMPSPLAANARVFHCTSLVQSFRPKVLCNVSQHMIRIK